MPMAEDLEGRTLLSVGLDPTYGFGGVAEVNVPATTATTSFSQSNGSIALQNGQVVQVGALTTTTIGLDRDTSSTTALNVGGSPRPARSIRPSALVVRRRSR